MRDHVNSELEYCNTQGKAVFRAHIHGARSLHHSLNVHIGIVRLYQDHLQISEPYLKSGLSVLTLGASLVLKPGSRQFGIVDYLPHAQ